MADDTRVYVACLASYNNGVLHGEWLDVDETTETEDLQEEINRILRASPFPNVAYVDCSCDDCHHEWRVQENSPNYVKPLSCPNCESVKITIGDPYPSAEEFAIHDTEGFGDLLGEYPSLEDICRHARMIAKHDGAWIAYVGHHGAQHATEENFEESYQGEHKSVEEYAEQWAEDTGMLGDMPENLRVYFDFERFAHDMECGGDIFTVESDGGVYVFLNC